VRALFQLEALPSLPARLLLYAQNRVFCRLSDSEFDDGFSWNLDLLLRLRIKARARFSLLLYELANRARQIRRFF
jgi:hypothetical protein